MELLGETKAFYQSGIYDHALIYSVSCILVA